MKGVIEIPIPQEIANILNVEGGELTIDDLEKMGRERTSKYITEKNKETIQRVREANDIVDKKRMARGFIEDVKDLQIWQKGDRYTTIDNKGEPIEKECKGYGVSFIKIFLNKKESSRRTRLPFSL